MSDAVARTTIMTIALSLGIKHIKESGYSVLDQEVQKTLVTIIADAQQIVMCRRGKVMLASDINESLESNLMEPLYGYSTGDNLSFIKVKSPERHLNDLQIYDDVIHPCSSILRRDSPPTLLETCFEMEWICLNGQNIKIVDQSTQENATQAESQVNFQVVQRRNLETELEQESARHIYDPTIRMFYQEMRDQIISSQSEREKQLNFINESEYIQELVPHFLQFVLSKIKESPTKAFPLYVATAVGTSLVNNNSLFSQVHKYSQHLVSIATSLIISPSIGPEDAIQFIHQRQSAVRFLRRCAYILGLPVNPRIEAKTQGTYQVVVQMPFIQTTITPTLLNVLLSAKNPLRIKYGAALALSSFGLECSKNYLLPLTDNLLGEIQSSISDLNSDIRTIAIQFYDILLSSAGRQIHADTARMSAVGIVPMNIRTGGTYSALSDIYGSDLAPYYIDESSLLFL